MTPETEGQSLAEAFRREHHLGAQPIADLFALYELVPRLDVASLTVANPDEHGMTAHDPHRGVTKVVVACTPNPMRQRSTLAHELAHVLFRDYENASQGGWADREHYEKRADGFARHLLVPLEGLRDFLGRRDQVAIADLSKVVQWFQASPRLVLIQMERAHYVDEVTKALWWNNTTPWLAGNHGWTPQYRAMQVESQTPRAPQRLLMRATRGYQEGILSLPALARLRGATPNVVEAELDEAGITVADPVVEWATPVARRASPDNFADLDALEDVDLTLPSYADNDEEASDEQTGENPPGEAGRQGDA
ncbi:MAG: ImmA/IrrE family metallo-endopeptidase [Humibacillus sp.]|nr:ImmA/IrrE family metallo-endopeptidase [Humibacillus sp.]MDN5775649.1 ImmA/IrrE family metallo-endopeptidase [Humibacillus sp.]